MKTENPKLSHGDQCPECGRLGQRMEELHPDDERYFTPDGIFIPPKLVGKI